MAIRIFIIALAFFTANITSAVGQTIDMPMDAELWQYLRGGINYVEASGRNYPTDFVHPGGKAYGPLALTPIAIEDVIGHYAEFSQYSVSDVLSSSDIYEKCAAYYASLLLDHYLKVRSSDIPREKLFDILQRAWFLGPGLYKKGLDIPGSREFHAREYVSLCK